jgi:hypothetical protein
MRAPLVGVVGLLFLVSGCVGTGTEGGPKSADAVVNTGDLKLEVIADPATPEVRSLAAPPQWRMGEWWSYRLTDQFTGTVYEFKRIVTGTERGNYLVGMPADGFMNAIMVLHVPGFGEVKRDDLSFEIHDFPFQPLRFPLLEGAKWDSQFEGPKITVEVKSVSDTKAEIQVQGAYYMNLTYDAELGEISKLAIDGYASYEVTGHGVGYEGLVTVPHMHDIIFQHFRIGQVFGSGGTPVPLVGLPLQPSPSDTVHVDATYDRVSFAIIMGTILPDVTYPEGYYSLTATAPDGTVYENTLLPVDGTGLKIWFYRAEKPGGDWKFEHVVAGPGITLAEGIAYHVYDVEMPSGRVMPSMGEHKHGG